ncbi:N-acetyltransferase family protein [Hominenteromicrobium sp.]
MRAARRMGFGQIELGVFSCNGRAKRLYEKMDFVCCGTTPRAVRYKDGSYDDEIMMVKRLETT